MIDQSQSPATKPATRPDAPRLRGAAAMPRLRPQAEHDTPRPRKWGLGGARAPHNTVASKPVAPGTRPRIDVALLGLLGLWALLILGLSN